MLRDAICACLVIRLLRSSFVVLALLGPARAAWAQHADLIGYLTDDSGAGIPSATITVIHEATQRSRETVTARDGSYVFTSLAPGSYTVRTMASGFSPSTAEVRLEVGQTARLTLKLTIAGLTEDVAVTAPVDLLRSQDGSVGTLIDNRFASNIPLSGRTFHSLLDLTPGVLAAPGGGFATNGQRSDANYFMVDGISGNVSAAGGLSLRNSAAGQSVSTTAIGSMSTLASVDALQEFRIQTSTFAPEYGRTPGAQVNIVTRSGSNRITGTLFEMVRNDALDATNWFINNRGLEKPPLRQHDFGGVLGGPLVANRVFYFASYEGLRLRQPKALVGSVPSRTARASAAASVKPLLDLFPLPTGPESGGLLAEYAVSASEPTQADTSSLRLDITARNGSTAFLRLNHVPSSRDLLLATAVQPSESSLSSATLGTTYLLSRHTVLDVRANATRSAADGLTRLRSSDSFPTQWLPTGVLADDTLVSMIVGSGFVGEGRSTANRQEQVNVIGTVSMTGGGHTVKTGLDYRLLQTRLRPPTFELGASFDTVADLAAGRISRLNIRRYASVPGRFTNVSLFVQDTWSTNPRLTLTYGMRWDVNPAPHFPDDEAPLPGTNVDDLSLLDFGRRGDPLWKTQYGSVAPRLGVSYALTESGRLTLTGGVGRFYDIGGSAGGAQVDASVYPNSTDRQTNGVLLPLTINDVAGIPPEPGAPPYPGTIRVVDPNLRTAVTTQWNAQLTYAWNPASTLLSVAYVGADGDDLISTTLYRRPNARFPGNVFILRSDAQSRYHSLQVQARRRMAQGLQLLASYTYARAYDDASGSFVQTVPSALTNVSDWGPSDFDVRHAGSAAVSWNVPVVRGPAPLVVVTKDWSVDTLIRLRSALPLTVITGRDSLGAGSTSLERTDRNPSAPVYIDDASAPGGRRLNPAAFVLPTPGLQGNSGRNSVRGFGAAQVDLGIRRQFRIHGRVAFQVRLDAFNLFNQPNFANPLSSLANGPTFGRAATTLNTTLSQGGLTSLYQWGGARSLEAGFKVLF